jgi:hypothetical protein
MNQTEQELQSLQELVQTADEAFRTERVEQAATQYKIAIDGFARVAGENHPDRLQCMKQLAECYSSLKHYDQAKAMWREICIIMQEMDPLPAEKYVIALFKYTKCCEKEGISSETEQSYNHLQAEADRLLHHPHPLLISIRQSQIAFLRHIGNMQQARALEHEVHDLSQEVSAKALAQNMLGEHIDEDVPIEKTRIKGLRSTKAMNEVREPLSFQATLWISLFGLVVLVVLGVMLMYKFDILH